MAATNGSSAANDTVFRHYPSATQKFQPPLIGNENAFLGDIFSSAPSNTPLPITSGLFRLKPGTPLEYTYTYHEMKVIVEGDFQITDIETGKSVKAAVGDVFYFPKGANIRFETVDGGVGFYTGLRKEGTA